jgi:bifunctional enzyme CysN/CysC
VFLIDGDNVRQGLNADLGFSPEDRSENIRRVGEVAALMAEAGMIVISAFISPYRLDRDRVRAAHPEFFHEIYINAPLEVCESRDVKGLYQKARAGQIAQFTGVSAPYEAPLGPELEVCTGEWPVARCLAELAVYVQKNLMDLRTRAKVAA